MHAQKTLRIPAYQRYIPISGVQRIIDRAPSLNPEDILVFPLTSKAFPDGHHPVIRVNPYVGCGFQVTVSILPGPPRSIAENERTGKVL